MNKKYTMIFLYSTKNAFCGTGSKCILQLLLFFNFHPSPHKPYVFQYFSSQCQPQGLTDVFSFSQMGWSLVWTSIDNTPLHRTLQCTLVQSCVVHGRTVQGCEVKGCIGQYSAVLCSALFCNAVSCSAVFTVQYSTVQC